MTFFIVAIKFSSTGRAIPSAIMTRSFGPSSRALQYTGYNSLADVNDIVDDDMYDPETNPGGIVNLGTTINPLMLDMVEEFTKGYNIDAKLGRKSAKFFQICS